MEIEYDSRSLSNSRRRSREAYQSRLRDRRREDALMEARMIMRTISSQVPVFCGDRDLLLSSDLQSIYKAAYKFRLMLSKDDSKAIQEVVDSKLIYRFVELLSIDNILYKGHEGDGIVKLIRQECAWVLTNVLSGSSQQTFSAVTCGVVPLLLAMLGEDDDLTDQAIWALGNIAGDSFEIRSTIINTRGALDHIVALFSRKNVQILRNATWLLSNLNRDSGKYLDNVRDIKMNIECHDDVVRIVDVSFPIFKHLISSEDFCIVDDAFWGLGHIACGRSELLLEDMFILNKAVEYIRKFKCLLSIVRMIGNIVLGPDHCTDVIVKNGILERLVELYNTIDVACCSNPSEVFGYSINKIDKVQRDICWIVSNVCAGTQEQVDHILSNNFISFLVRGLSKSNDVQYECCWGLISILESFNISYLNAILESKVIQHLNEVIFGLDTGIIVKILNSYNNMLRVCRNSGVDVNSISESTGMVKSIDVFKGHPSNEVREKISNIFSQFHND